MIITKSVSRFARNSLDCISYVRQLNDLGVDVYFEKEGIHTSEQSDETLLIIMGIMAQNESFSLSKNVRLGYQQGYKSGKVIFHRILGYLPKGSDIPEIIPEEAEIVRKIYDDYISGLSIGQIRKYLEDNGILTVRGKPNWSEGAVQGILRNEKYVGDALLQKTFVDSPLTRKSVKNFGQLPQYYVRNNHPPIIDRDLWNKVQEEIARRVSMRKRPSKYARGSLSKFSGKYALNGILVCEECGANYRHIERTSKGEKEAVWRCINRLEKGKRVCRKSVTIREVQLHEIIRFTINQVVSAEVLSEVMTASIEEFGLPELVPEISSMILNDPPELLEYDDRYAHLMLHKIEVKGNELHITLKDGVSVAYLL